MVGLPLAAAAYQFGFHRSRRLRRHQHVDVPHGPQGRRRVVLLTDRNALEQRRANAQGERHVDDLGRNVDEIAVANLRGQPCALQRVVQRCRDGNRSLPQRDSEQGKQPAVANPAELPFVSQGSGGYRRPSGSSERTHIAGAAQEAAQERSRAAPPRRVRLALRVGSQLGVVGYKRLRRRADSGKSPLRHLRVDGHPEPGGDAGRRRFPGTSVRQRTDAAWQCGIMETFGRRGGKSASTAVDTGR